MKNGETHNYNNRKKRHFRRTIWNLIRDRLTVPAKDAVVLYLSGINDWDRDLAKSHGFKDHNLITVDSSPEIVKALRSNGKISICGKIEFVAQSWGSSVPINVVYGDFCGGLQNDSLVLSSTLFARAAFESCVVAVNFLRGRDPDSNDMRQELGKHRARAFFLSMQARMAHWLACNQNFAPTEAQNCLDSYNHWFLNYTRSEFGSYPSGVQFFDFGVWRNPSLVKFNNLVCDAVGHPRPNYNKAELRGPMSFQVSAAKAVRKQRLNVEAS